MGIRNPVDETDPFFHARLQADEEAAKSQPRCYIELEIRNA